MRVWVDLTNTAHVPVLRPLVELLESDGHDVELTARPLSHTLELLDDWGHPYRAIGRHGGAGRAGKALAAAGRVRGLLRFARGRNFDFALGHASVDLPPAARLLRIPNTTMFDYEWATAQHNVVCRLANRVLVPDAIPAERLERYGARPPKLVQFEGLKEEYYLSDWEPDSSVVRQLGRRPPPHDLRRAHGPVVRALPRRLGERAARPRAAGGSPTRSAQTVVLARTDEQRRAVRAVSERFVVPDRAVDGSSLVAFADVLVSAGGTMNREAAVLGTPVWSIFEGRLGGVDERLVAEGRLKLLADPAEIELKKKPAGAASSRVRRDPRRLLELAQPRLG